MGNPGGGVEGVSRGIEVIAAADSPHGKKHVLTGRIQSPAGKTPLVQSIWIVDKGLDGARLMTAYPRKA
jgi:hypothetical protein